MSNSKPDAASGGVDHKRRDSNLSLTAMKIRGRSGELDGESRDERNQFDIDNDNSHVTPFSNPFDIFSYRDNNNSNDSNQVGATPDKSLGGLELGRIRDDSHV